MRRPIYPTQLYSVLGNIALGFVVLRLWILGSTAGCICGAYLVLSGLLRFVEEGYRGEVQTPVCRALPIYQWFAVLFVVAGGILLPVARIPVPAAQWAAWPQALAWGLAAGLVTAFAMSVDNPESEKRFGRLSS